MKAHWKDIPEGHLVLSTLILHRALRSAPSVWCRITRRSQQIADFLLSGHKVPEYNMDQIRAIIEGPNAIIYHIQPD
jgi:toxin ParE1/3/4